MILLGIKAEAEDHSQILHATSLRVSVWEDTVKVQIKEVAPGKWAIWVVGSMGTVADPLHTLLLKKRRGWLDHGIQKKKSKSLDKQSSNEHLGER